MNAEVGIERRQLLVGGIGLLLGAAGCSASAGGSGTPTPVPPQSSATSPAAGPTSGAARPSPPATPRGSPSPRATATGPVSLPRVSPWVPTKAEVHPEVKLAAVRVVEAIGTWGVGHGGRAAAAARVSALGQQGSLARQALPLVGSYDNAAVQVIDAQYGGILATSASVLVACQQSLGDHGGRVIMGGTTVDVRLHLQRGHWIVTQLRPADPGRPARRLSSTAKRVLASSRIGLPPASVADIRSGQVHESVLRALLSLARDYRIDVSVIRSGHPKFVFGTIRLSDHPRGRAFDTWRIDGHAVVDTRTSKSLIVDYMRAAASAGSYNVGGPYLLSGRGNQFFSDPTHHDHVHAGFLS
jgi:hypothetical protein